MTNQAKRAQVLTASLFLIAGWNPGHADEVVRHRGRCQSLTILDRRDPLRCSDEMLVQVNGAGQRGFVFHKDRDVVLFVTIDQKADRSGLRYLPVSSVQFGIGDETETILVLSGSCRSVDPVATWRAETTCEAETTKGRFAAQFITIDGAIEPLRPSGEPPSRAR